MYLVLDSGVVGLATTQNAHGAAEECQRWLARHVEARTQVVLPDIIDYETRRALIHRGFEERTRRLDTLSATSLTLRVTQQVLRDAAGLWAEARRMGRKTDDDKALDIDMILCAQARSLVGRGRAVVVATANVRHLAALVDARRWTEIPVPA